MAECDPRIELLGRKHLLQILNEHCGGDWFNRIDRMLGYIKHEMNER